MDYTNGTRRTWAALVGFVGSIVAVGIATMSASEALGQVAQLNIAAQNDAAIGVNGANLFNPVSLYTAPTGFGAVFLLPYSQLPLGGTNAAPVNFNNKISAAQGAYTAAAPWAFPAAGANLAASSLQITSYAAQGISRTGANAGRVGISSNTVAAPFVYGFAVKLNNAPPPAATVHWLQVIDDNNAIIGGVGNPGTQENIIDINAASTTPYYDGSYAADTRNFFDGPGRGGLASITANNFWIADLYVASGPAGAAAGPVTVYNGMSYGWANIFINTSTIAGFLAGINNDFANVANLDGAFGDPGLLDSSYDNDSDPSDLSLSSIDTDIDNDVYELPEPSSLVVLLGMGVAMLSRRRRDNAALAGIGC